MGSQIWKVKEKKLESTGLASEFAAQRQVSFFPEAPHLPCTSAHDRPVRPAAANLTEPLSDGAPAVPLQARKSHGRTN